MLYITYTYSTIHDPKKHGDGAGNEKTGKE